MTEQRLSQNGSALKEESRAAFMDGKVILPGFIAAGIVVATIVIGWMAKLKLVVQIWSKAKSVMSVIARLFKKDSPPHSGGITAGDHASLRGNVVAGRDAKVDQSHRTRVSNFFQIFNMTPTHDREHKQRTARRRNRKGSGKDVDESSGTVSEEDPHPGLPSEQDKANNRPTADQYALEGDNGVNAIPPTIGPNRADAGERAKSDRPIELDVIYEDDSDVSHAGDADERDLYLEAVERSTLIASPSGRIIEPNWSSIDRVEEPDKAEAASFSGSSIQPDQEAGVPEMDESPAEVPWHNAVNESTAPDVNSVHPYPEGEKVVIPSDSAILQNFAPAKFEEVEGDETSNSQNSSDQGSALEDVLAIILRSYPLATIGEALRSRRFEVTISQPDINYDRGWVSQLEQGSFPLTPATLPKQRARLRRYLQVVGWTPEALLSRLAETE